MGKDQESSIWDKSTLCRYAKKFHESGGKVIQKVAYCGVRQVFDENMETICFVIT